MLIKNGNNLISIFSFDFCDYSLSVSMDFAHSLDGSKLFLFGFEPMTKGKLQLGGPNSP